MNKSIPIILLMALLFVPIASSTTVYVNTTGWYINVSDFNTTATPIQFGIDNASSYDTVYIWNGSYTENIDISTHNLTIEGEGSSLVTVTAASSSDHTFNITSNYVNITCINVTGAYGILKGGVFLNDIENCNVSNNIIINNYYGIYLRLVNDSIVNDNTANSNIWNCVYLYKSNDNTITNNNFSDNVGHGINVWHSDNNTITDNIADSNGDGGISMTNSDNNTITDNTMNSNSEVGVYVYDSDSNTFTDNNISDNCNGIEYGIWIVSSASYNTFTNNTISNNKHSVFLYPSSSYNTFTNNTISDSTYGIIAYASSHNVVEKHNSDSVTYDYYAWSTALNNTLLNCNFLSTTSMMNDSTSQWYIKYDIYNNITNFNDTTLNQTVSPTNVTTDTDPTTDDYVISMTTLNTLNMSSGVDTVNIKLVSYSSGGHSDITAYSSNTSEVLTINVGTYTVGEAVQLRANNIRTQIVNADSSGIATFTYSSGFSSVDFDIDQSVNVTLNDTTNYTYTIDSYSNTSFTSTINLTWNGNGSACAVSLEMPLITTTGYTGISYDASNITTAVRVSNISSLAFCNFTITSSAAGSTYIVLAPSAKEQTTNLPVAIAAGLTAGTITVIVFLYRRRRS